MIRKKKLNTMTFNIFIVYICLLVFANSSPVKNTAWKSSLQSKNNSDALILTNGITSNYSGKSKFSPKEKNTNLISPGQSKPSKNLYELLSNFPQASASEDIEVLDNEKGQGSEFVSASQEDRKSVV